MHSFNGFSLRLHCNNKEKCLLDLSIVIGGSSIVIFFTKLSNDKGATEVKCFLDFTLVFFFYQNKILGIEYGEK